MLNDIKREAEDKQNSDLARLAEIRLRREKAAKEKEI